MNIGYKEFNDSRLAKIYDSFCPLGTDSKFFLGEIESLKPKTVLDVGSGSGILTVEFAKIAAEVIGLEPALPMLELARNRDGGEKVSWLHGYALELKEVHPDVVIMTSHVAQFILDDVEWQATLQHFHDLLNKDGKLIFDSRNPLDKTWLSWGKHNTNSADTPLGRVTTWNKLIAVRSNRISYQLHYRFHSGEKLVSDNELIYRSKKSLVDTLQKAGFIVENVYGGWDRSKANDTSEELIFVAHKV